MTEQLTPLQVDAGWVDLTEAATFDHYSPLAHAAHRLIAEAQTDKRIFTGLAPLDVEMRGISPGHLAMIIGYSHSGKTLLLLHMIRHNVGRRIAWFVPDEPAPLILTKLACMEYGVSGAELEARLADGDPWGIRVLNETIERYENLAVFDHSLTPRSMTRGYDEACQHWGCIADLVIVDYMELVRVGESLAAKAEFVKGFGSDHDVPMAVAHQVSRSAGSRGQSMRIDSGNFGGETWATFQIGVSRRKSAIIAELTDLRSRSYRNELIYDRIATLEHDLEIAQYTVTVNLNKNKRPSGRLVDDVEFEMDLDTGVLTPLNGDLPHQYRHRHLRAL